MIMSHFYHFEVSITPIIQGFINFRMQGVHLETGEREKKNKRQESEDVGWARLDKRIERAIII